MDNLLQIVTGIINGDDYAAGFFYLKEQHGLLQTGTVIRNSDVCVKLRQLFYYKVQHIILKIATGVAKFDGFSRNCDGHYKHSATNSPSSFYLGQRDCKKRRSLVDVPVHLMGYARSNFAKKNKRLFTVYDYNYKLQHAVQSSKIHVHFLWCDKMRISFKTLLLD